MAKTSNDDLPWWNVHVEAVGDEQYEENLLEDLLDNLLEHDGVVTGTPEEPIDGRVRYGAGFSVQATDAVEAVARVREVFERAVTAAGLPRWPLARIEAQTERELEVELARPKLPRPDRRSRAGRAVGGLAPASMDGGRAARLP